MLIQKLLELNHKDLEIILVDKSDHFEYNCSNYKSVCDNDTFKDLAEPFTELVKGFNRYGTR